MKIAKHNAHGMQLLVQVSPKEAIEMLETLFRLVSKVTETDLNTYIDIPCEFEDDNDQWVKADFTLQMNGDPAKSEEAGCQSLFPCGKPVRQMGVIPAGPCDRPKGHEPHCCRRNAKPDYSLPWTPINGVEGTCDTGGHSGDRHPKQDDCINFILWKD